MSNKLNMNQTGLAVGSIFGILHLLWVTIVGIGSGQWLADWWYSTHFVIDIPSITGFSIGTAIIGVIGAFISGYVLGWVFAAIWNWAGEKAK